MLIDLYIFTYLDESTVIFIYIYKYIYVYISQLLVGSKKGIRRHQRESKKHMTLSQEVAAGTKQFPTTDGMYVYVQMYGSYMYIYVYIYIYLYTYIYT
jgi:hypothetical protein